MLVTLVVLADLAAAAAAPPPTLSPAEWIGACVAALERAGDEYAKLYGQRIRISVRSTEEPWRACPQSRDEIEFELRPGSDGMPGYSGAMVRGLNDQGQTAWTETLSAMDGSNYVRSADGRHARLHIHGRSLETPAIRSAFRAAIETCFAAAPPVPRRVAFLPPTISDRSLVEACAREAPAVPLEKCRDAERAAFDVENACVVVVRPVAYEFTPGYITPEVRRILALGAAAEPILLRLARSPNPAARALAATGLRVLGTDGARRALERLAHDDAATYEVYGLTSGKRVTVSSFAR